jgi:esterase/lipase superfamily enzyme
MRSTGFTFHPFLRLLAAVVPLIAGCASEVEAPEPAGLAPAAGQEVEIYYATDRAPAPSGADYGGERGGLSFGIASIGIPPNHEIGRQEAPSVFRFEWSPDERKHIALKGVLPVDRAELLQQLAWEVARSPDRRLMVFVHGYNVEFSQAARRVAQFATDLKFAGPVVLFSWPSQGGVTAYSVDETNADWAQPHLVEFLNDLVDGAGARKIYLVAHSMGARLLTRAFLTLAGDRWMYGAGNVREMILVAPDIDADLFRRDIAPRLAATGVHVTLYASSGDRALMASHAFHGYPRAGDSGDDLVIVAGVETVDVSGAAGGLLGHSYFAEDRRIMEDIFALLQTGSRADGRFGLAPVDTDDGRYWTFRK